MSGWEQRNADFCKAQTDAQLTYIEAERRAAELEDENAKLRELVRDMWHDGMCECDERGACAECEYHYTDRMRELGVNV